MVSMQIADVQDEIDHELITKAQIASKIHEVAAQVSKDYQGRDLLLVAVLKGAVNTIAAFSQALSIPVQMDFMSLSSYGSGTESSGTIAIRQDLSCDVRGRHILIAAARRRWSYSRCWRSRRAAKWTSTCGIAAMRFPMSSWSGSAWTMTSDSAILTPSPC